MQIERIPFPPIGSNMYVVTQGRDAIVLDPWPDEATMQRLQGYHALIVLTHEHIDHISGLGRMQRALSARTLWQENCTPWLRNPGNTTPVLLAALSVSRGAEARYSQAIIPSVAPPTTMTCDGGIEICPCSRAASIIGRQSLWATSQVTSALSTTCASSRSR